jgi:hypothetical protein
MEILSSYSFSCHCRQPLKQIWTEFDFPKGGQDVASMHAAMHQAFNFRCFSSSEFMRKSAEAGVMRATAAINVWASHACAAHVNSCTVHRVFHLSRRSYTVSCCGCACTMPVGASVPGMITRPSCSPFNVSRWLRRVLKNARSQI